MTTDYHDPLPPLKKDDISNLLLPIGEKNKFKKRFKDIKMFEQKSMPEQIYVFMGTSIGTGKKKSYFTTFPICGSIFGVSAEKCRKLYLSGEKRILLGKDFKSTGKSKLTNDQSKLLINEIFRRERDIDPMDASDIVDYVQKTFNITVSESWPYLWAKQWDEISNCTAEPIEKARALVTKEDLKKKGEELIILLKNRNPQLIYEWDESSKESRSLKSKSVFVSKKNDNTTVTYASKRPSGHTTYLWCVGLLGDVLPPLIIISQTTAEEDLKSLGLLEGPNAYIISTSKGYITSTALQ